MHQSRIAFTDLEMTGLDPLRHEIIEFGMILADRETLEEIARFEKKVIPEHIELGMPEAFAVNGYKPELWLDAVSLTTALEEYSSLVTDAIFAAWNTPFDWTFLAEAYKKTGIQNPLDYHTIDVFTLAFEKLAHEPAIEKFRLSRVAEFLGIQKEPMPHRAVNGAEQAYFVYKKLRERG